MNSATGTQKSNQTISGCISKRIRRKALREPDLTLEDMLNLEISEQHASGIESTTNAVQKLNISKMETKPQQTKPKSKSRGSGTTCFNCGKSYPHPDEYPCLAKGKTHHTCGKKNHFQSVCRSGPKKPPAGATRNKKICAVQHAHTPIKQENSASSSSLSSESSSEIIFGIHKSDTSLSSKAKVKLNNHDIEMMTDSGASINIHDKETFEHTQRSQSLLQLTKAKDNAFAYCAQNPLQIIGKFDTTIETTKNMTVGTFYITEHSTGNLLSYKTATELALLKINVDRVQIDKSMQNPSSKEGNHKQHSHIPRDMSTRLIKEHSNLFQGVGKLKDAKIHVYIDENVCHVAQPAQRVPFHI